MTTPLDAPKPTLAQAGRKLGVRVSTPHRRAAAGVAGVRLPITRVGGPSDVLVADPERFVARSDPRPAAKPSRQSLSRGPMTAPPKAAPSCRLRLRLA